MKDHGDIDEWGTDLEIAAWLVRYARRVPGRARDIAKRALEENPALRFSERVGDDAILAAMSDEQRRLVGELILARQQSLSEWFSDVVMDMGLGRSDSKEYPGPSEERQGISIPPQPRPVVPPTVDKGGHVK